MATLYYASPVRVPAEVAWDFLVRYSRSEVHVFSACRSERQEGDCRVVTLTDGSEVRERNITVDGERRRAVYTVPGLLGAEHHQAEMRVEQSPDGDPVLVWCTDVLPDQVATRLEEMYAGLFAELVEAVNRHGGAGA
jgi:hypothetical protein